MILLKMFGIWRQQLKCVLQYTYHSQQESHVPRFILIIDKETNFNKSDDH